MSNLNKYMQSAYNYVQNTHIFFTLFFLFFTLNLEADGPGSNRYRDKFSPEREESVGEGKGDGKDDRGTKGGKSGRKKKRDDDVVIPFGLEEKAPSKVFLEIEHGEIIATSYTGFTEHEPAWEPIVWSPLADSWDRDSLGVSIQRELVEPVENNGILWSSDGHHSSAPEIGQDLGLGDTGVLLIGFAGQLSIQGSARSIIRSIGILRPGAVAVAAGRALSAATRLAPRVGHRVTPVAMISAPGFIILDTVARPRGPFCDGCGLPTEQWPPWYPRPDHTHPGVPPHPIIGPMPAPDPINPGVPPDTITIGPRPSPDADVDDLTRDTDLTTNTPNQIFDHQLGIYLGPGVYKWYGVTSPSAGYGEPDDLVEEIEKHIDNHIYTIETGVADLDLDQIVEFVHDVMEFDGISVSRDLIWRVLESYIRRKVGQGQPGPPDRGGLGSPENNGILPPFILFPIIGDEERKRWREYLGTKKSQPLSVRDYLNMRGSQNAMRHHVSPVY